MTHKTSGTHFYCLFGIWYNIDKTWPTGEPVNCRPDHTLILTCIHKTRAPACIHDCLHGKVDHNTHGVGNRMLFKLIKKNMHTYTQIPRIHNWNIIL